MLLNKQYNGHRLLLCSPIYLLKNNALGPLNAMDPRLIAYHTTLSVRHWVYTISIKHNIKEMPLNHSELRTYLCIYIVEFYIIG